MSQVVAVLHERRFCPHDRSQRCPDTKIDKASPKVDEVITYLKYRAVSEVKVRCKGCYGDLILFSSEQNLTPTNKLLPLTFYTEDMTYKGRPGAESIWVYPECGHIMGSHCRSLALDTIRDTRHLAPGSDVRELCPLCYNIGSGVHDKPAHWFDGPTYDMGILVTKENFDKHVLEIESFRGIECALARCAEKKSQGLIIQKREMIALQSPTVEEIIAHLDDDDGMDIIFTCYLCPSPPMAWPSEESRLLKKQAVALGLSGVASGRYGKESHEMWIAPGCRHVVGYSCLMDQMLRWKKCPVIQLIGG